MHPRNVLGAEYEGFEFRGRSSGEVDGCYLPAATMRGAPRRSKAATCRRTPNGALRFARSAIRKSPVVPVGEVTTSILSC